MKWEVVELMGYAYYAEKGYRICVPLVQNNGHFFNGCKSKSKNIPVRLFFD